MWICVCSRRTSSGFVVALVELENSHHVAYFRVLVCLGAIECLTIDHLNGVFGASSHALEITEVGKGKHSATTDGVGVARDRANNYLNRVSQYGVFRVIEILSSGHDINRA